MSKYDINAPAIYRKLNDREKKAYITEVLKTMEPELLLKVLQTMPVGETQHFLLAYNLYHATKYGRSSTSDQSV